MNYNELIEIPMSQRVYWKESDPLKEGEQWWCHTYCLPDVDDNHSLCVYVGKNGSGDFVFHASESVIYANQMLKFREDELPTLVFKEQTA